MIILGLGSNLHSSFGDRFKNIQLAIKHLEKYKFKIVKKSSFYETPSYPNRKNPKFINIVIKVSTNLLETDLVSLLMNIEEKLERKRSFKNEPRTCDIDIIDFNNKVLDFNYKNFNFKIPHDKLTYRNFVLFPLKEIFPNWKHPKTNEHIDVLIDRLSEVDKNSIFKVEKY